MRNPQLYDSVSVLLVITLLFAGTAALAVPMDEVKRDELSRRCFVWRPTACRPEHKKADDELIKKVTRGFKKEEAEKLITKEAWKILLEKKDAPTALLRFNQSLIVNAKSAEAWWGAGTAAAELLLTADADKCLNKSIALDPKNPLVFYNLAKVQFAQKKDLKAALKSLQASVALDPRYRDAYKLMALTEYNLNDFKSAKLHYDQAILLGSTKEPEFEARLTKALAVKP